jgi:hypothetical protein
VQLALTMQGTGELRAQFPKSSFTPNFLQIE